MAVESEEPEAPQEEAPKESVVDAEAEDMSLQGIFGRALDGGEDDEEPEESKETLPPATPVLDSRYSDLEEKFNTLRDKQVELETENNIYRSGLLRDQQRPMAPAAAPAEDNEIDFDELNKAIQADPAKAIVDLVNRVAPKIARTAEQRAVSAAASVTQTQQIFKGDQERSYSDFGDYWEKDKEFTNLANNYYDQITANSPIVSNNGSRYHNGAIYAAMSMAYATLDRQGKLSKKVVPLMERRKPALDPGLGSKSEKSSDSGLFDGIPAREISAMKRTAEKMGVKWEDYKARMGKLAAREPGFGGLRK